MSRLRNRKTGEIGYLYANKNENYNILDGDDKVLAVYKTLKATVDEWEEYEEPKEIYWIDTKNGVVQKADESSFHKTVDDYWNKEIGNRFETEEEAEKAVERLRAWTRLEDKGFRFRWIDMQTGQIKYSFYLEKGQRITRGDEDDLLLLFGGEE